MKDFKAITKQQWLELLSPEEYHVCREGGTEPAFSGRYCEEKRRGTYRCRCCSQPLFTSDNKYDSGSGWSSFYQPVQSGAIIETEDASYGMARVETSCSCCGGHLGHVFTDGPEPTGRRYCTNSLSLSFQEE